jgi:DNA-binding transcriptional ArsR family regulator
MPSDAYMNMSIFDDPAFVGRIVERFRALADPTRVRLLARLKQSPSNGTQLTALLGLAQPQVSKHLAILRRAGLVRAQRVGTQVVFHVADEGVSQLCQLVCAGVLRELQAQHVALSQQLAELPISSTRRTRSRKGAAR